MDSSITFPLLEALFPPGGARAALEWTGAILGLLGALLLALRGETAKWAWPLWLISNITLVIFGLLIGAYGLATMQAGFMTTSLLGCWNWLIVPLRKRSRAANPSSAGETA